MGCPLAHPSALSATNPKQRVLGVRSRLTPPRTPLGRKNVIRTKKKKRPHALPLPLFLLRVIVNLPAAIPRRMHRIPSELRVECTGSIPLFFDGRFRRGRHPILDVHTGRGGRRATSHSVDGQNFASRRKGPRVGHGSACASPQEKRAPLARLEPVRCSDEGRLPQA